MASRLEILDFSCTVLATRRLSQQEPLPALVRGYLSQVRDGTHCFLSPSGSSSLRPTAMRASASASVTLFAVAVTAHNGHHLHARSPQPGLSPRAITVPPIESIVPAMPTQTTMQPPVVAAGSKPSDIPNAPGLPSLSSWWTPDPNTRYPKSDVPPPTDSPEVLQWIDEVAASGIGIPDIKPFKLGDAMCAVPENKARIGNDTECWWTCGHCVRATDVTTCNEKFTWGSSFDDGPAPYTPDLLEFLDKNRIKSTFFVVGSRVKDRPAYLQAQYAAGHQIAVHTWSHSSLTTLTTEQVIAELGWTKKIIQDAIGVTPKYMRPPFGDIDDRVRAISMAMGLTPIIWTNTGADSFDTFDWMVQTGVRTAQESLTQFEVILGNATQLNTGFIVLQHDLWESQVALAIGYFLPSAIKHTPKLNIQSIRECIGQPAAEVYVETASKKGLLPGNGVGGKVTAGPALKPRGGSGGSDDGGNYASSLQSAGALLLAGLSAAATYLL